MHQTSLWRSKHHTQVISLLHQRQHCIDLDGLSLPFDNTTVKGKQINEIHPLVLARMLQKVSLNPS